MNRRREALQQSKLAAFVKFNPESSQLIQLMRDARLDLQTGVKQERGIARAVKKSAQSTIPKVRHDYETAAKIGSAARATAEADLSRLGSVAAAPYLASAARERSGAEARIAESRANAVQELRDRVSGAASGRAYAVRNLRAGYQRDRSKLVARLLEVAREQGAFTAATYNSALEAIRRDETTRRGQSLTRQSARERNRQSASSAAETRRHNRATEADAAAGGGGGGKSKKHQFTATSKRNSLEKYDTGVRVAKLTRTRPKFRASIRKLGGTEVEALANVVNQQIKSPTLAYAAAQTVIYGGAGPNTWRKLKHRFGIAHHVPKMPRFPAAGRSR